MPAVGDLDGLRQSVSDGLAVAAAPITRDDLDCGALRQPRLRCGLFAVLQQGHDTVALEVADQGTVAVATSPREVVNADHAHFLRWFATWRDNGLFETINHRLIMTDRERVGREASPTAVVLDSQSVKTIESGGPSGYDAGKKVKGRKRQVMVDTDGRGMILDPQPASVQDRDGAPPVLRLSRRSFPFVTKAFADSGYAGQRPAMATIIDVEIVKKPKDQIGFAVHPHHWVVERFFAWISRNRRLWKDSGSRRSATGSHAGAMAGAAFKRSFYTSPSMMPNNLIASVLKFT